MLCFKPLSPLSMVNYCFCCCGHHGFIVHHWGKCDQHQNTRNTDICRIKSSSTTYFVYYSPVCLYDGTAYLLTHNYKVPHFDALKIYSCGKHCEKRRNCLLKAISPFPTMFSTWHLFLILNVL